MLDIQLPCSSVGSRERARRNRARSTCILVSSSRLERRRKEEIETLPKSLAICACLATMEMVAQSRCRSGGACRCKQSGIGFGITASNRESQFRPTLRKDIQFQHHTTSTPCSTEERILGVPGKKKKKKEKKIRSPYRRNSSRFHKPSLLTRRFLSKLVDPHHHLRAARCKTLQVTADFEASSEG